MQTVSVKRVSEAQNVEWSGPPGQRQWQKELLYNLYHMRARTAAWHLVTAFFAFVLGAVAMHVAWWGALIGLGVILASLAGVRYYQYTLKQKILELDLAWAQTIKRIP